VHRGLFGMTRTDGGHSPDTGVRIGICGPLAVSRNGVAAPTLPGGQRTVLGLLALSAGSSVLSEAFFHALWPGDAPASATGIVHSYVSRLRVQLQDDHRKNRIVRVGGGYKLLIADEQLDALVFRKLTFRARDEADVEHACGIYAEALSLWRGSPLEDVEPLRSHPAVVALSDERIAVALEYAKRASSVGDHDAVLVDLAPLCSSNSLDERLHAALMIALAGSGRQAEALSVYEELRARLDEELGMPPGEELRTAHQRILRQEVVSRTPSRAWRAVRQLPPAPADFTGRKAEVAAVVAAATVHDDELGVPIVLISGQPGVGKTALGLHAAHAMSVNFPDGQLWVHLAGASSRPREPAEALAELLRAVGVPGSAIPDDADRRSAVLRSVLAGRRVLVVADDVASMEQVAPLVPGTAGCALISTSRMHLAGFPGASHIPLDALPAEDGVNLLARQIGTERVNAEPNAAVELVNACGSLPLALRIVGGKLAARPRWPVSAMLRRLAQAEKRLSEFDAGNLSVRASIASSYRTLPELHQTAFRRLAILGPNDFARWVVEVMMNAEESSGVLDDLVDASLVMPAGIGATGEPRYRLHDLVREYADEQLAEEDSAEVGALVQRLNRVWLQLAAAANHNLPPAPYFPALELSSKPSVLPGMRERTLTSNPIAWFTEERQNLIAVIEHVGLEQKEDARLLALLHASFHYLEDRHDDAVLMWSKLLPKDDSSVDGCWSRLRLVGSLVECGRAADALAVSDACVDEALWFEDENPELLAFALYWRASCSWDLDDYREASAYAQRGVDVASHARLPLAELHNLRRLSTAEVYLGNAERAIALAKRAAELSLRTKDNWSEFLAVHLLATVYRRAGQHQKAVDACIQAISLSHELGSARDEAISRGLLGDAYHGLGRYEDAIRCFRQIAPVFESDSAARHAALCWLKLGYAHEAAGEIDEAVECLEEAVRAFQELRLERRVKTAQQALDRCRQQSSMP
jgi:DNA-binding SARP family transcriptional activator/tetratricopeptide (TPR) repeat protein